MHAKGLLAVGSLDQLNMPFYGGEVQKGVCGRVSRSVLPYPGESFTWPSSPIFAGNEAQGIPLFGSSLFADGKEPKKQHLESLR